MGWWRRLFADDRQRADAPRWVVVDTETTGIDASRDALLAIGAVAVDATGVLAHDSFEVVLRHTGATDAANVALHGIGREALEAGEPPARALAAFAEWVAGAPCAAFHADFDRQVIERAARSARVDLAGARWLDLAPLAAALAPHVPKQGTGALDDWLVHFDIACPARHHAASDAFAAAELLLRLRAEASRQGANGFDDLVAIARQHRWLGVR